MKRCPTCNSVFPDDKLVCGICGKSLSDVPVESIAEIRLEHDAAVRKQESEEAETILLGEKERAIGPLAELIGGAAALVAGFILIGQFQSIYGVVAMLLGLALVAHVIALPHLTGRRQYGRV